VRKIDRTKAKRLDRTIHVGTSPRISGMKFGILSELFRTVPDLGTCRNFFRGDRALDAVTVKIGRMGSFDNWDCEKSNSDSFCVLFTLPSKIS
jgi:hypothetical protein